MGISQIKGHRIAKRAVTTEHLHQDFKLKEEKMELNHPTHDNSGDLTEAQKNTLTQMGNADTLHYHTGGGGGPQGIYTNEERDIQLLKLSMLLNATKYGMDKSVKDVFDDDSSVDYGIKPASTPMVTNLTDDHTYGGSLSPLQSYSYGVVYKTKYGKTNMINSESITTKNGGTNAVKITLDAVPAENKGFEIYRCDGKSEKTIVENEVLEEWDNPFNLEMALESTDKTSGLSSTKVSVRGYTNASGTQAYVSSNIAYGVGKRVNSQSESLNSVLTKEVPFTYLVQIMNRGDVTRLDLVWDKNPSNIPMDYELYYTTDFIGAGIENITWSKFNNLSKVKNMYNVPLSISTDGSIANNSYIKGNTRPQNVFLFKRITDITCIKVVIKKVVQSCNLTDIRLFTEDNSSLEFITKDFGTPQTFSEFNTLKLDVKSNGNHNNMKIGFLKNTEVVTGAVTDWNQVPNTSISLTGKTLRCRVRSGQGAINRSSYDRIRIAIRPVANQYLKLENTYLMIDTRGHAHDDSILDSDCPEVVVPITWNNGLPYYEATPNGSVIYSDWVHIDFPNKNFQPYIVNFSIVSGGLQYYNNQEWCETWTSLNAHGLENSIKWNGMCTINDRWWNWNFIEQVQLGQSNSKYMDLDVFNPNALEKWHKHYVQLPPAPALDDVKKMILFFNNLLTDQDVLIDNISLTRSKNVLNQVGGTAITGSNGYNNVNNIKLNDNSYSESDLPPTVAAPKSIMISMNTPMDINKLVMYFGNKNYAAKNYAVQYSNDTSATVNDLYEDTKWLPMESLVIGEEGIPTDFTGNIVGNIVYENNVWDSHITHTFKTVNAVKVRIVYFATMGNSNVRTTNIKLMTAEDNGDFKMIYESANHIINGYEVIDDGKPYTSVSRPLFNTTGSHNVLYDSNLRVMRLIDKSKPGVVYLEKLDIKLFKNIILTAQTTGSVLFSASIDDGKTFEVVYVDTLHTFAKQSSTLILKAEFQTSDAALSALAFLYSL